MNNNIQESYCSFEVRNLLKEKGFDHEWYDLKSKGSPTHALAIEWIRVNFGIWISVDKWNEGDKEFWFIIITEDSSKNRIQTEDNYSSPQKATEAALLYVLTNIIIN